jgi:hypothetical protein
MEVVAAVEALEWAAVDFGEEHFLSTVGTTPAKIL